MKVYVVVSRYMQGVQDCALYRNRDAAFNHIREHNTGGNPGVLDIVVIGEPEDNKVYTVSTYEPGHAVHVFESVYADYAQAKLKAGEKGLVLTREING